MAWIVLATSLRLRKEADVSSEAIGTAPKLARIQARAGVPETEAFVPVRYNNQDGWMSREYLVPEAAYSIGYAEIASMELGIGEFPDTRDPPDNERIREYHEVLTQDEKYTGDETAWCSSFMAWCFKMDGRSRPGINQAARSWWNSSIGVKVTSPQPGDLVVFWRRPSVVENSEQATWPKSKLIAEGRNGHVGIYLGTIGDKVSVLGGNQSSSRNGLGEVCIKLYPSDSDNYGVIGTKRF